MRSSKRWELNSQVQPQGSVHSIAFNSAIVDVHVPLPRHRHPSEDRSADEQGAWCDATRCGTGIVVERFAGMAGGTTQTRVLELW